MRAVIAWCAPLPGEGQVDRLLRLLTTLVVLLFPAACLLINRSDSLSLLLLGFIGLWVWTRNGFRSGFSRGDWLFVAAFAGFFFVAVLAFEFGHQTDQGFRLLGRYLRFLFVLPVLLALRRYPPPAVVVWAGLGLGALVLGCDAVWESVTTAGAVRPAGDTNVAILFGDLATLTGILAAAGYVYIDARLPRIGPVLVLTCLLSGALAGFLSGTRGAWIAVPVLLILFLSCRHLLSLRKVLVGAGVVAALFGMLTLIPQTQISSRMQSMVSQLKTYWIVTHEAHPLGSTSECLDVVDALQAWVNTVAGTYSPEFDISLAKVQGADATALARQGCNNGLVVQIRNMGRDAARIQLPRYVRGDIEHASTRLLVKGTGFVGFADQKNRMCSIDTQVYISLTMTPPDHYGAGLAFELPPGATLFVLPIESYFGEYRYALLQTPIGKRLEMWSAAIHLFRSAPFLGIGTGAYQAGTQELVQDGMVALDASQYDHPHSDYFDALSSRGFVGLLALCSLFVVPGWLYQVNLNSRDPHRMGAALGGLLVTVGFAIFGLTETVFIHSVTIGWYVIMTAIFLASTDAPRGQDVGKR